MLRGDERFASSINQFAGPLETFPAKGITTEAGLLVLALLSVEIEDNAAALAELRTRGLRCPILILTDAQNEAPLLRCVEAGATDFIPLPLRKAEVVARLMRWSKERSTVERVAESLTQEIMLAGIIGESHHIRLQVEKVHRYSRCDAAVLISGETGTGKEVFARAIHYTGLRSNAPFVPVNCGALPLELVENELFGHESGAYTGAKRVHHGLIQQAEGGTLFLDEIDSLPLPAQAKLLRFLQEREYRPLGSSISRRANVRVISASNSGLADGVRAGRFRQDLYFRLNVLSLHLPPLRERREDIPALANYLVARHGEHLTQPVASFKASALQQLMDYDWPGNVRELENVIERALVFSTAGVIDEASLDLPALKSESADKSFKAQKRRVVLQFERRFLQDTLARHGGNITRAAKAAEKDRRAFFELLRKHKLAGRLLSERTPAYV